MEEKLSRQPYSPVCYAESADAAYSGLIDTDELAAELMALLPVKRMTSYL